MSIRDLYSNFGFYDAFMADITSSASGAENGNTIDLQGLRGCTFIMNAGSFASAGALSADNQVEFILQHGLASAAGVSAWSVVPNSLLINSIYSSYNNASEDGIFAILTSTATVTSASGIFKTGYKGDNLHRYIRVVVSNIGAASTMWLAGICLTGNGNDWAVNDPA